MASKAHRQLIRRIEEDALLSQKLTKFPMKAELDQTQQKLGKISISELTWQKLDKPADERAWQVLAGEPVPLHPIQWLAKTLTQPTMSGPRLLTLVTTARRLSHLLSARVPWAATLDNAFSRVVTGVAKLSNTKVVPQDFVPAPPETDDAEQLQTMRDRFTLSYLTLVQHLTPTQAKILTANLDIQTLLELSPDPEGQVDWGNVQLKVKAASNALLDFIKNSLTITTAHMLPAYQDREAWYRAREMSRVITVTRLISEMNEGFSGVKHKKSAKALTPARREPLYPRYHGVQASYDVECKFFQTVIADCGNPYYSEGMVFFENAARTIRDLPGEIKNALGFHDDAAPFPEKGLSTVFAHVKAAHESLHPTQFRRRKLLKGHLKLAGELCLARPKTQNNLEEMAEIFYLLPLNHELQKPIMDTLMQYVSDMTEDCKILFLYALFHKEERSEKPMPQVQELIATFLKETAEAKPCTTKLQLKKPGTSIWLRIDFDIPDPEPEILTLKKLAQAHNNFIEGLVKQTFGGLTRWNAKKYKIADVHKIPETERGKPPINPDPNREVNQPALHKDETTLTTACHEAVRKLNEKLGEEEDKIITKIKKHAHWAGPITVNDLGARLRILEAAMIKVLKKHKAWDTTLPVKELKALIARARITETIHHQRQEINANRNTALFYSTFLTQLSNSTTGAIALASGNVAVWNDYTEKASTILAVVGSVVPGLSVVSKGVQAAGRIYQKHRAEQLAGLIYGNPNLAWELSENISRLCTRILNNGIQTLHITSVPKLAHYLQDKLQRILTDEWTRHDQEELLNGNFLEVTIKMVRALFDIRQQTFVNELLEPVLEKDGGGVPQKAEEFLSVYGRGIESAIDAYVCELKTTWTKPEIQEDILPANSALNASPPAVHAAIPASRPRTGSFAATPGLQSVVQELGAIRARVEATEVRVETTEKGLREVQEEQVKERPETKWKRMRPTHGRRHSEASAIDKENLANFEFGKKA